MTKRTDAHRPSAIIPTDYKYVVWYACSSNGTPSANVNCELDRIHDFTKPHYRDGRFVCVHDCPRRQHSGDRCCVVQAQERALVTYAIIDPAHDVIRGSIGKCGVCGANYVHGELWRHEPTGQLVHLGHDCADKYGVTRDRSDWIAWHKQQTELRARSRKEARFKMAAIKFLDEHPGLQEVLELDHPILRDMGDKLNKYGSLSEKQLAFAARLADEVRNPKPKPVEEAHVPAPEGRTEVTGEVVSAKFQDGGYMNQGSYKMTVKVQTPAGSWLVWSTIPQSLLDAAHAAVNGLGSEAGSALQWLRGKKVTFVATLSRGKDAHFAFGKRPTGAALVS